MTPAAHGKSIIDAHAKRVDPQLKRFFRRLHRRFSSLPTPQAQAMLTRLEGFCLAGGKRLRPTLVHLGYELLGGKDSDDLLTASLVVELAHAFFLIHDDIMDESALRRGNPTVHQVYAENGKWGSRVDPQRFGESMAILVGDLACALTLEPLLATGFDADCKLRVIQKVNDLLTTTMIGQELDLVLEARGQASEKDVLAMYRLKTAHYSFVAPLHIGALLAGGDKRDLDRLTRYGLSLGVAFQMHDDLIGTFGDEKQTGKPDGADLVQGKQTLLVIRAMKFGSKSQRDRLRDLLGKKPLSADEIKEARQIITRTGAKESVEALAKRHGRAATRALHDLRQHYRRREPIEALAAIAAFITHLDV